MRTFLLVLASALLAACCLPAPKGPPNDGATIARVASGAVMVLARGGDGDAAWGASGSGTVVWRGRGTILVLTCRHVAAPKGRPPATTFLLRSSRGDVDDVVAVLEAASDTDDLALLRGADLANAVPLRLAPHAPGMYERLYVVASPNADPGVAADAILSGELQVAGRDVYRLTSFLWPGSSGGTVANAAGDLVAVARGVEVSDGDDPTIIPQIGYAVAWTPVRDFLRGRLK